MGEVWLGEAHGLGDGFGFTTCRDTPVLAGLLSPEIGFDDGFPVAAGGLDVLELGSGVVVPLPDGVGAGVPVGFGVTGGVGVPELLGELEDGEDVGCTPPGDFVAAGDVVQVGEPEGPGVVPGTATTGSPPVLLVVPDPLLLLPELLPPPRGEFELLGKRLRGASKAT